MMELTTTLHKIQYNKELWSKKEIQVFELDRKGLYMSSGIAPTLNISKTTVSMHRKNNLKN